MDRRRQRKLWKDRDLRIGPAVRNARKWLGMTQRELAIESNLTQATISRIEDGKVRNLRVGTIIALSLGLGLTPNDICGWYEIESNRVRRQSEGFV